MEILIHGTKGGYKVLFKTQNVPFSIPRDARRTDVNMDRATVGQFAYSITYDKNGCAFSKYIGIWDVGRRALGNISFSVFIPFGKRMKGDALKKLIDDMATMYFREYITDGNLSDKQEDWVSFIAMANEYDKYIKSVVVDELTAEHTNEPAFLYYNDENVISQYFESPFIEEYDVYRQVFFVDSKLKDKSENPLNALTHKSEADLTGRIDLDNPKYKINFRKTTNEGVNVDVFINNKQIYSGTKFRRKEELLIIYSKQYFKKLEIRGKIDELKDNVSVDSETNTVTLRMVELDPIRYSFTVKVVDTENKEVKGAEIILINPSNHFKPNEIVKNNKFELTAEQLQDRWRVTAKKDGFYIDEVLLTTDAEFINKDIILKLQRRVFLKIKFIDKSSYQKVENCKVFFNDRQKYKRDDGKYEFSDEEIDQRFKIEIRHSSYENYICDVVPSEYEQKVLTIELVSKKYSIPGLSNKQNESPSFVERVVEKQNPVKYPVSPGEHGVFRSQQEYYSNDKATTTPKIFDADGSRIKYYDDIIKPKFGYVFSDYFDYNEDNQSFIAHYSRVWLFKPGVFVSFIIGLLLILFYFFSSINKREEVTVLPEYDLHEIERYVKGNELNRDSLTKYKNYCYESKKRIDNSIANIKENTGLRTFISNLFSGRDNYEFEGAPKPDSLYLDRIKNLEQEIDSALLLLIHVKSGNVSSLKKYKYSIDQNGFKKQLDSIKENEFEYIGKKIKSPDSTTIYFDSLASIIRDWRIESNPRKPKKEERSSQTSPTPENISTGNAERVNSSAVTESKPKRTNDRETSTGSTDDAQIKEYLKSDFTYGGLKIKLQEIENGTLKITDQKLVTSIKLAMEFWSLPAETTYYSYLKMLEKDNNLKNSKLKNLLVDINKKYSKQSPTPPSVRSISKNKTVSITIIANSINN